MKTRLLALTSIASVSALVLASLFLSAKKGNSGLTEAGLTKTSHALDITSLSYYDRILNTTDGNPIQFGVASYDNGTFTAGGIIRNRTALSGLESITVTGIPTEASLSVSYGWADGNWDVTDGVIDYSHPTYDFKGELPSYFSITSAAAISVGSISLSYSCEASTEPIEYVLSFMKVGETEYRVSGCKSGITQVAVPSSYKGLPVTSIGNFAFYNHSLLTSIDIPVSVTSIGQLAFNRCTSLAFIDIPSSITSVGLGAFEGCTSLASISIPSSLTSIGHHAFNRCSSLVSVSVDPGNPVYDNRGGCNAVIETSTNKLVLGCMNTVVPSSVTSIGDYAFSGCSSLASIAIPSSVTSIGDDAFVDCSSLASIDIPSSVTSIGDDAFSGCSSLASISVDPANLVYDSRGGCNAIIETSSNLLVTGCQNTTIPSSVTSIGDYAFYCNLSLTSINIPSSVTSIGESAFDGCSSLASIVFGGTKSQWKDIEKGDDYLEGTLVTDIVCTDGTVSV